MKEEDFKEIMSSDGLCLAYKEGDKIYPALLDENLSSILSLALTNQNIQIVKNELNEYKKTKK